MDACVVDWGAVGNFLGAGATFTVGLLAWRITKAVQIASEARNKRAQSATLVLARLELQSVSDRAQVLANRFESIERDQDSALLLAMRKAFAAMPSFSIEGVARGLLVGDFPESAISSLSTLVSHCAETDRLKATIAAAFGFELIAKGAPGWEGYVEAMSRMGKRMKETQELTSAVLVNLNSMSSHLAT